LRVVSTKGGDVAPGFAFDHFQSLHSCRAQSRRFLGVGRLVWWLAAFVARRAGIDWPTLLSLLMFATMGGRTGSQPFTIFDGHARHAAAG
jgi:hypothetical protein